MKRNIAEWKSNFLIGGVDPKKQQMVHIWPRIYILVFVHRLVALSPRDLFGSFRCRPALFLLRVCLAILEHFPDGLRKFQRKVHDGIVLDDMRDFYFCELHQEKLQGKVDTEVEFATTPSGQYAFSKWLWRVPIVVTANYTTKNRDLLDTSDFLANTDNRVLVERTAPRPR